MMRIAHLNTRGGGDGKPAHVSSLLKHTSTDIAILTETKTFKLPHPFTSIQETSSHHGLIVSCCSSRFKLIESKTIVKERAILATFDNNNGASNPFSILAVYGPAQETERAPFWRNLASLTVDLDFDLLIGDLNVGSDPDPPLLATIKKDKNLTDSADLSGFVQNTFLSPSTKTEHRPDRCLIGPKFSVAFSAMDIIKNSRSDHYFLLFKFRDNDPTFNLYSPPIPKSHVEFARKKIDSKRLYKMKENTLVEWCRFKQSLLKHLRRLCLNPKAFDPEAKDRIDFANLVKVKGKLLWGEIPKFKINAIRAHNRELQKFSEVRDAAGSANTTPEMLPKVHQHYQTMYAHRRPNPVDLNRLLSYMDVTLSPQDISMLGRPFTRKEVCESLKAMMSYKAPGPDGIHAGMYKELIKIVASPLRDIFNKFLRGEPIPSDFKSGVTSLIFKKKGETSDLNSRRPITLLNTDYKILSRMITSRLMKIAKKVINPFQTGFVTGRSIFDNIVGAHIVKSAFSHVAFDLIDFERAYDSVFHDTIVAVLKKMAFPENLVNLIHNMIKDSFTRFIVNGSLTDPVSLGRGFKQGDPLSPLLFNFAIEPLARAFIKYLPDISPIPRILGYADDLLICRTLPSDTAQCIDIFRWTEHGLGLRTNHTKCVTIPDTIGHLKDSHVYPVAKEPVRYLGFMLSITGLHDDLNNQIKKAAAVLQSWRRDRYISIRAKALILKIFGLSVVWYHMSLLPVTAPQCKTLENMQNWFMWDKSGEPFNFDKSYPNNKMSKQRMIRPLTKGGIQLFCYPERAIALKCRVFRRMLINGEEWLLILLGNHCRHHLPRKVSKLTPSDEELRMLDFHLEQLEPLEDITELFYVGLGDGFPVDTTPDWKMIAALEDPVDGLHRSHHGYVGVSARRTPDGFPNISKIQAIRELSDIMELIPAEMRCGMYRHIDLGGKIDFLPTMEEIFSDITGNQTVINTDGQNEWERTFKISFSRIWSAMPSWIGDQRDKNVTWNLLQSTLSRVNKDICSNCPYALENREHIFFTCPRNCIVRRLISKQARIWKIRPPDWTLENLLRTLSNDPAKLFRDTSLLISATGLAWRIRNKQKFDYLDFPALKAMARQEWQKTLKHIDRVIVRKRLGTARPQRPPPYPSSSMDLNS